MSPLSPQDPPNLAESHVVRHLLLWSGFSDYQILPAFDALKAAQALNPNVGHYELGMLYAHVGMIDEAQRELGRAAEIDPTNDSARAEVANAYWYSALYDEAIEANQALARPVAWAYLCYFGAGRLDEARRMIDAAMARSPEDGLTRAGRALLLAMEGRHSEARALLPALPRDRALSRTFHHGAYQRACIHAPDGEAETAVDWLGQTVKGGVPIYPAFARDACFEPIRRSPQFERFMSGLRPVWDEYTRKMR